MSTETASDTRSCDACGAENSAAAHFCGECGRALEPPAPRACRACGAPLSPVAHFCTSCGAAAEAPAREAPPAAPRRPALGRLPLLIAAGVVAALALVAVVAFPLFGGGGGEDAGGERLELPDVLVTIDPTQLSVFQAIADTLPEPQGETDRDQLRSLIGLPDTFTITFERAGADGSGPTVRYETWFYYDLGTAYEFADGGFVQDMPMTLPGGPVLLPPRRYDPALFGRDTTWEEITALLLDPAAFGPIELEEEYEVPLTFYAGEQLIVAFDDEGLFSVESVALAEGEE